MTCEATEIPPSLADQRGIEGRVTRRYGQATEGQASGFIVSPLSLSGVKSAHRAIEESDGLRLAWMGAHPSDLLAAVHGQASPRSPSRTVWGGLVRVGTSVLQHWEPAGSWQATSSA